MRHSHNRYKHTSRKNQTGRQGFTLIEVMIVLFILMVLASMTVLAYQSYLDSANKRQAKIYVESMSTPLEAYKLDNGTFPSSSQGLQALIEPPSDLPDQSKGSWPYISDKAVKLDPWGMPYQYQIPGSHNPRGYDLWSYGPDMADGTGDDIGNWN